MSERKINGNIVEIETSIYYQVILDFIPRTGDLISLFSYLEQSDGNPPVMQYEVVQVLHHVSDVTDKVKESAKGHHYVEIHVKRSNSDFFSATDLQGE